MLCEVPRTSQHKLQAPHQVADLILLHCKQFAPRYKGLIPLKRVYVPEAIEEAEE